MRLLLCLGLFALPLPALAQTAPPQQDAAIVVQGSLEKMSDWRVAETDHVLAYSTGPQGELTKIAHNLERLHFLLSILLNRVDQPDDTIKLRVTLVGDAAEFDAMDLKNFRSRQGPFAPAFQLQRYYDPREDGAVMASGRTDQVAAIERQVRIDLASLGSSQLNPQTGQVESTLFGADMSNTQVTSAGSTVPITAEGRIYAGFAQHYLLTYFPAAYPRWYLDGFGELFSTIRIRREDGAIEYGHMPEGYRRVIESFGNVPVADVVTGRYFDKAVSQRRWTPFHAWILTHFMFFSEARRPQFSRYLSAIGHGATLEEASKVFGDLARLEAEVKAYDNKRLPYERMTYPAERAAEPLVQQLTRGQAEFLKGRLELGSRVEIPAEPVPGMDAKAADRAADARKDALAARARWLSRLRNRTGDFPGNLEAQVLMAEAECRSGNTELCLAAAERALRVAPNDSRALAWKGIALAQQAIAGPADQRPARLRTARIFIARANRADTEATLPLIAYFRSFADAGEAPPEVATVGLLKATDAVPAAPGPRLLLGEELARQGQGPAARKILEPVAHGPYDSPERPRAAEVLGSLPGK
ncbi:MAG: hypothetical protein V4574_21440 [Pseudomonadota bacterium]